MSAAAGTVLDQHVIFLGGSLCLKIEHVRKISVVDIWTVTIFFSLFSR